MSLENTEHSSAVRTAMAEARQGNTGTKENKRHPDDQRSDDRDRGQGSRRGESSSNLVGLGQIGRVNQTPMPMTGTAQALTNFHQDFIEAMPPKDDNSMFVLTVTPIDASTAGIPLSAMVVAGFYRNKPELGVGYHTFLLAGSAEELRPREDRFQGRNVKIVQVAGDAYDDETRAVVKDTMRRLYPNKNLFSAFGETIGADFPAASVVKEAIADCVKNSLAAIKTALDRNDPNSFKLTLAKAEGTDQTYNTIHVQHRQNHLYDRAHEPVRADVVIDLQSRPNKGRSSRDSIDQLVTGTLISRLGGYWDLVYAPTAEAEARQDRGPRRDRSGAGEYQTYLRRFITTFIDTIDFSPTTMLLAQATMMAAADKNELMRAYEPNQQLGEDDLRNIGVLAIEPNLDEDERGFSNRMSTKSPNFTTGKRNALLKTVLRDEVMWSIDVPECGAASWQFIDLLAAAEGDQAALGRIYDAAYDLTDGHIADFWDRGAPIFDDHIERIHGGYHTEGTNGQRLDVRDLDYIALLNMIKPETEEDLLHLQRWSIASTSNEDDLLTQSERYDILNLFMPSSKVTKYFRRLNYRYDWIEALGDAIARCELSLNPSSSNRDANERYRTTYGNLDVVMGRAGTGSLYRNQRRGRDRYDRDDRDDRNGRRDRYDRDDRYDR